MNQKDAGQTSCMRKLICTFDVLVLQKWFVHDNENIALSHSCDI